MLFQSIINRLKTWLKVALSLEMVVCNLCLWPLVVIAVVEIEVLRNNNLVGSTCFDYKVVSTHRAAVLVEEDSLASVMTVLSHISPEQAVEMHRQVTFLWRNYFSSIRAITLTTLQIINDRVFPYVARKYEEWNDPPNTVIDITSLEVSSPNMVT